MFGKYGGYIIKQPVIVVNRITLRTYRCVLVLPHSMRHNWVMQRWVVRSFLFISSVVFLLREISDQFNRHVLFSLFNLIIQQFNNYRCNRKILNEIKGIEHKILWIKHRSLPCTTCTWGVFLVVGSVIPCSRVCLMCKAWEQKNNNNKKNAWYRVCGINARPHKRPESHAMDGMAWCANEATINWIQEKSHI